MSTYFNTTDSPVVIDGEGRILGGKERADLTDSSYVSSAVEAGILIPVDEPEDKQAEAAPEKPKTSNKNRSSNNEGEKQS